MKKIRLLLTVETPVDRTEGEACHIVVRALDYFAIPATCEVLEVATPLAPTPNQTAE